MRPIAGTRVDISATGTVSRVPDLAIISAGVVTKSATATGAIADNAARMERVRAALRRAGIEDRDIQTSSISLNPDYRYQEGQPPVLTGYGASNNVAIKFRDIRKIGPDPRRAGRAGRQPDQRPVADHRQARGGL